MGGVGEGERGPYCDNSPSPLPLSRARVLQGVHANFPRRPKASDSLFVMANHGQLLEYSLDPVPDQSEFENYFFTEFNVCLPPAIAKDKVCESSPIDLNIVAFGQWNLAKSGGKERCQ